MQGENSVTATDADNDELTYTWQKVSGPGTVSFSPIGKLRPAVCRRNRKMTMGETSPQRDAAQTILQPKLPDTRRYDRLIRW